MTILLGSCIVITKKHTIYLNLRITALQVKQALIGNECTMDLITKLKSVCFHSQPTSALICK